MHLIHICILLFSIGESLPHLYRRKWTLSNAHTKSTKLFPVQSHFPRREKKERGENFFLLHFSGLLFPRFPPAGLSMSKVFISTLFPRRQIMKLEKCVGKSHLLGFKPFLKFDLFFCTFGLSPSIFERFCLFF